ncbi:DMT family transporter [Jeotgalibacillus terrae]|uniref:DMT family transporter n=1 Tax=Jeotgalibacillus terrae TaxID=587735 RepID=A0ABW5ZIR2_9BACL|nr:SMR family transporter [Jeotgalibacillus terrae]MBM7579715.1 paired small multidrug resistance pump [Jeotgalibacillus terrae]
MWWLVVAISALFEVGWATGLKYAHDGLTWALTIGAIIVSFVGLLKASTKLPTATVYAVFVGLGTLGTVIVDMIFFDAGVSAGVIFFVIILLVGVVGLKFVTDEKEKEVQQS